MKTIYTTLLIAVSGITASAQSDYPTNAIGNNSTATTVTLSNFSAQSRSNAVELTWAATGETNMREHVVEKSRNGEDFRSIGTITAQNIGTNYTYSYIDATPVEGMNYYRIRTTDKSGKQTLSNILTVNNGYRKRDLAVMPNPVRNGVLNMQLSNFSGGRYNISLVSNNGQRVYAQSMNLSDGTTTETVYLPRNLSAGMYVLHITDGQTIVNKQVMLQ